MIKVEKRLPYGLMVEWGTVYKLYDYETEVSGIEYNKKLVEFCKDNGIKGARTGLRTTTLIEKIKKAGYEIPARA